MPDLMDKARAAKTLADTKNNRKSEVALFLGVFYPEMSDEQKRKVLNGVKE